MTEIITEQRDIEVVDDSLNQVILKAEKQLEVLSKVLQIAIKRTLPSDWVNQNGKPYLTCSGAEKIVPLFGISILNTQYKKEHSRDDEGDYYFYHYSGTFSWKGGTIEAIGTTSSRDKFFGYESFDKKYKPLSQVDETNIMKSAYSNMIVNGITRLLGIRNITWDMIKECGINTDQVAKVEYKMTDKKIDQTEEKKKQKELQDLLDKVIPDKAKQPDVLMALTEFTGADGKLVNGIGHADRLTGKRLDYAIQKLKKEAESLS